MRAPIGKRLCFKSLSQTIERIFVCWFVCFSCSVAFFSPHVAVRGIGDKAGSWASGGTLPPSRANGTTRACFLNTRFQDPGIWGIGLASGGGMWAVDFTTPVWWSDFEHLNWLKAGSSLAQDNLSEIQTRLGQFHTLKCTRLPLAYSKKSQSFGITIPRPPLRLFPLLFLPLFCPHILISCQSSLDLTPYTWVLFLTQCSCSNNSPLLCTLWAWRAPTYPSASSSNAASFLWLFLEFPDAFPALPPLPYPRSKAQRKLVTPVAVFP